MAVKRFIVQAPGGFDCHLINREYSVSSKEERMLQKDEKIFIKHFPSNFGNSCVLVGLEPLTLR
jgi:hypothetical protein